MPAKRLTDAFVRNVKLPLKTDKPNQVPYIHTMERGLGLVLNVSYGGSRTFSVLTYDARGRPKMRKLGRYPEMKLRDARAKAREYFEDPDKFEAAHNSGTFEEIAGEWIMRHVEANQLRSAPEIRRHLSRYVTPTWKGRPFVDIGRRDVNQLLDDIADRNGPSQADAVLATLRTLMNWYQSRDGYYASPIVRGMRRSRPVARNRVLNDDELRAVWNSAEGQFGGIVKLCLLTAQRRETVARMRRENLEGDTWHIPKEPRSKGTGETLKLPLSAISIIDAQPRIAGSPFVFAGSPRGRRSRNSDHSEPPAFNAWSERKAELDAKLPDMPHWVVHDLRRTARSLMARAGVRPDVAERVLGHAIPGVAGIYDRHTYLEQKADALARLAALVEKIVQTRTRTRVRSRREP